MASEQAFWRNFCVGVGREDLRLARPTWVWSWAARAADDTARLYKGAPVVTGEWGSDPNRAADPSLRIETRELAQRLVDRLTVLVERVDQDLPFEHRRRSADRRGRVADGPRQDRRRWETG